MWTASRRRSTHACRSLAIYIDKCTDLNTHKANGGEVSLLTQEKHERLSLWITEPDVVLQDLGSVRSEHETREEHAEERVS